MRPRSYAEISREIGVTLCSDCSYEGRLSGLSPRVASHERGFYLLSGGLGTRIPTVHWRERRLSRSGVKRFLLLAARWIASRPGQPKGPEWFNLWQRIEWTRRTARFVLRFPIPPALWREEQARLAAKIAASPPIYDGEPSTALLRWEKERALRWTRRRSPA